MSATQRIATFREVLDTQVELVKEALPEDRQPLFHFTLYTEMLEQYLRDPTAFDIPDNVIIVWPDDNNGRMRGLPAGKDKRRHGVYYHLAYFGGNESKQSFHTVAPQRIAEEFKKIVNAGATEFLLVNVTELREFVMEARMTADIAWDGVTSSGDGTPLSGDQHISWWCREYFGSSAPATADLYHRYYSLLSDAPTTWLGSDKVQEMLVLLYKKCTGQPYQATTALPAPERYETAVTLAEKVEQQLNRPAGQFLFEQITLGLLCNVYTLQSARVLSEALAAKDKASTWNKIQAALRPLERLELAILRAERPPFEKWYRETWIRAKDSPLNLHRPYDQLQAFIAADGKVSPVHPPVRQGHNIAQAKKWTRFLEDNQ